ncbi:hypothetical protein HU200_031267 [Digitaria exilis]|uniref:Uncharacterized protein n=1 Tax=Digitaria exilis TaxID=1010633 RepID=A0A835BMN1_9POAL|nr:hypothetical protein HU200_031267 [Digitaria exilis]
MSEPPPHLNRNAYFVVALSGLFFAGMAQVMAASVCATGGRRNVAGSMLVYAPVVAAGLMPAASLVL